MPRMLVRTNMTDSLALPPERAGLVEGLATLAGKALEVANTWGLARHDPEAVANTLRQWHAIIKMIETEEDADCKPLAAEVKRRRARWKSVRGPLEAAIKIGKGCIDAWRRADEERALAALPAATSREEIAASVDALTTKALPTVKYYSARVVDETKLARRWWQYDQAGLDALARTQKEAFAEPGCELVVEERSRMG